MLWHAHRASTRDVDSARRFDTDVSGAVDLVGSRDDLRKGWLNDHATDAFRNAYPHAPDDKHVANYITELATDADTH